jgi:hypothetical protein
MHNIVFRNIQAAEPAKWPSLVNCAGIDSQSGVVFDNLSVAGKHIARLEDIPLNLGPQSRNVNISKRGD